MSHKNRRVVRKQVMKAGHERSGAYVKEFLKGKMNK